MKLLWLLIWSFPLCLSLKSNDTDYAALMSFKSHLILQPNNTLFTNWTSTTHFCNWFGVSCLKQRITKLQLSGLALGGELSPEISNMSRLVELDLSSNNLGGISPTEIGSLQQLRVINLTLNFFHGIIPSNLSRCGKLQTLDLSYNFIAGKIPEELGLLGNLGYLGLDHNNLTGKIPSSLGNFLQLDYFYLHENDLFGQIPGELGRLSNVIVMGLRGNNLTASIPPSIFNISRLQIMDLSINGLSGWLPQNQGVNLPNLERLFLDSNRITGRIPVFLSNASKFSYLILTENDLHGKIPGEFGMLRNFLWFEFEYNQISGGIPYSLFNITSLEILKTRHNYLSGDLPHDLGNWLPNLQEIFLSHNQFTGNKFEGPIPAVFCSIKILGILHLRENSFSGSIPQCIRNLTELREVSFAANNLNSTIPTGFWDLVNVEGLNLSRNHLHGAVPIELGNLKAVYIMDLSSNSFSGQIPNSVGNLQNLLTLDMSQNKLEGPIPNSLSKLIVIEFLDLSSNSLSGSIPESLVVLRDLKYLNLSFNMLQGEIPHKGVFTNISYQYLMGNPKLCGAPKLNFPLCSGKRKQEMSLALKITIPLATAFLLVFTWVLVWICLYRKRKAKSQSASDSLQISQHPIITYHELVQATETFSEASLLGSGSSGVVYKGQLSDGTFVAIKVFNMQYVRALENFEAECQVLSEVRHRNLVKIISTCSNLDFKAMNFKAMILEFMPNGSLDKWLYSKSNSLSQVERMDIVIDVAMAMEYLHHDYVVPIVHCDLKPSNVLLDENMTAHVADFGIAKFLAQDDELIRTKTLGTIGYIAPEYSLEGQVSTKGDVYSLGILLLETFTGKSPTDDMFRDGLNLHQWVNKSFPGSLTDVLVSSLFDDLDSTKEGSSSK